jgi:Arc/MetJ family transcription regulator
MGSLLVVLCDNESMRITIDIDESLLEEVMKLTGENKKSPAVAKAVENYVKRAKAKELGRMLREGVFDYPMTQEDIEARDK